MKPLVVYTALRLGVFVVAFGVLWLIFGRYTNGWAVAMLAIVITAVISFVAFGRQGRKAGESLQTARASWRRRVESVRAVEDLDDDQPLAGGAAPADASGRSGTAGVEPASPDAAVREAPGQPDGR